MTTKKPDPKEETEVEETEVEETEETDDTEANWKKVQGFISEGIKEGMAGWQAEQEKKTKKTISSPSPRKAAPPKRKPGFLSTGFFKGLNPEEESEA
jgi:hypothetical protein